MPIRHTARGGRRKALVVQVLSGNETLLRELQESLFGVEMYGEKPFGTVTIFCRDVRVATTVLGPGGELAIGILYVGVLERKYTDLRNRTIGLLSALIVPMLGLLLLAVFLIARGIVRPLARIVQAAGRVGKGKLDAPVGSKCTDRELDEANRDYQELLSFMTYELNNSIGSLLLNVSVLAEEADVHMDADSQSLVEQVLRDVERFRDMVRNYLNLSRLEKGTLRCSPENFDVRRRVIEPVLERLQRWIRHRGFELAWEWPGEVSVRGDANLLDIVYSNFMVNAVKYGRDWIRFSARQEESSWVLGIGNGGPLIPPEKIPLLFQKFYRLVKSDDGAGLGLYLVHRIVESHGGEAWCESDEKRGTVFYLRLPKAG